jgi:hypothetical protein
MREQGIDGYLVLTHDDYVYFFGEDRIQPRAIVPCQGQPIIVAFQGEAEDIRRQLGVEDVRVFAKGVRQPLRLKIRTKRYPNVAGVEGIAIFGVIEGDNLAA